MKSKYGVDSMPETAENVAEDITLGAGRPGCVPWRTQQRWACVYRGRIFQVRWWWRCLVAQAKGDPKNIDTDEHPRPDTTLEALAEIEADREADRHSDCG